MSHVQKTKPEPWRKPWLTKAALWFAIAAWACLGVSGWLATAEGVLASVLVGLTLACDVLAARLPVHADGSPSRFGCGLLSLTMAEWDELIAALEGGRPPTTCI
jgi:hypothetical protein